MAVHTPGVGLADVVAFLKTHYGGRAHGVTALSGGAWSAAFSFSLGHDERVIRFGRHKDDYEKDRAAMAFAGPDLPVPPVLEIGQALDGYYAVSERRHGVFLETLDETRWRRVLPALLRALDTMRLSGAPAGAGCELLGTGSGPITWREWLLAGLVDRPGGRVSGWRATLAQCTELEELFVTGQVAFTALLGYLPERRDVVHADLINANVLVTPDGSGLAAVFDWGCGAFGDFLYEVAWLTFWAPWYPALHAVGFRDVVRAHHRSIGLEVVDFDQRVDAYELHIGLTHLAYNAFCGNAGDQVALAQRMRAALHEMRA